MELSVRTRTSSAIMTAMARPRMTARATPLCATSLWGWGRGSVQRGGGLSLTADARLDGRAWYVRTRHVVPVHDQQLWSGVHARDVLCGLATFCVACMLRGVCIVCPHTTHFWLEKYWWCGELESVLPASGPSSRMLGRGPCAVEKACSICVTSWPCGIGESGGCGAPCMRG